LILHFFVKIYICTFVLRLKLYSKKLRQASPLDSNADTVRKTQPTVLKLFISASELRSKLSMYIINFFIQAGRLIPMLTLIYLRLGIGLTLKVGPRCIINQRSLGPIKPRKGYTNPVS
jgi:hypothetical protein